MTGLGKYLNNLKDTPVIYINPIDAANFHSLNKYKNIENQKNWDKLGRSILNSIIFESFQSYLNGADWESTKLYKFRSKRNRCFSKFHYWHKMLHDIVSNGYTFRPYKRDPIDEYMSILIGRNGHMFLYNGIHRFCCCLLSEKTKKIPVKVIYRHPEWESFRNKCIKYQNKRGELYCQLPHPDLEHIPFAWTNERADLISENSNYPSGNLIDAGSHWGTVSYVLAQKGFDVTAVENSKPAFSMLKKVSNFPGKKFSILKSDLLSLKDPIDTLVILNIAHHFTTSEDRIKKFVQFLNNLKTKEIFYQAHGDRSKWTKYITPVDYLNLIMSASKMTKFKKLKTFGERTLYHLT